MIDVFTSDLRLTGKRAAKALSLADDIERTKKRADAMIAAAETEAAAILAAAREEARTITLQAEKDAEGVRAEAESQLTAMQSALRAELDAQMAQELAGIATQLSDIVLAAFEKLVGDIGATSMVRLAVLHILRTHPQIEASRLRVAACDVSGLADIPLEVSEDAGLGPGEALLETAQGVVELGRGAQLTALAAVVGGPSSLTDLERGAA